MYRRHIGTKEKNGVCVIGAGVSGIISTRYLLKAGMEVLTVEGKDNLGGTWYNVERKSGHNTGLKQMYGVYLPEIYDGLNTNIEQLCMTLKDMPYDYKQSIVSASQFLEYVHRYAEKFHLIKHMLFNCIVKRVRLISNLTPIELANYEITNEELAFKYVILIERNITEDHSNSEANRQLIFCDYIVSCNGLYNTPFIPDVKGRESFEGEEIHTNAYVNMNYLRSKLENKRIIVVGSNQSGRDIVSHCLLGFKNEDPINVKNIIHCVGSETHLEAVLKAQKTHKELRDKLKVYRGRVSEFTGPNKVLMGGEEVEVDVIVWATGYNYKIPFLDPKDNILEVEEEESKGRLLHPLYLMTFSINQPTFARPLVPYKYKAELLLNLERQILMISAVFSGMAKLPTQSKMMERLQKQIDKLKAHGYDLTWFHKEIEGLNDQNHMMDEWFKLSGCNIRDLNLDRMMDEMNHLKVKILSNGDFYHYPKPDHFNINYTHPLTSDKF